MSNFLNKWWRNLVEPRPGHLSTKVKLSKRQENRSDNTQPTVSRKSVTFYSEINLVEPSVRDPDLSSSSSENLHHGHDILTLPATFVARQYHHPITRHVSVSRSGRYKQKLRKRSNLLLDFSPKRETDHEVFEYDLKSFEQDVCQTEIEVRIGRRESMESVASSSSDGRVA